MGETQDLQIYFRGDLYKEYYYRLIYTQLCVQVNGIQRCSAAIGDIRTQWSTVLGSMVDNFICAKLRYLILRVDVGSFLDQLVDYLQVTISSSVH